MVPIAVSDGRRFHLHAPLARCEAHFGDFRAMLEDLPSLRIVSTRAPGRHRLAYSAAIADVYRIRLLSDVQVRYDASAHALLVWPDDDGGAGAGVPASATPTSLTGQGRYHSRLVLQPAARGTDLRYEVRLSADLPTPVGLRSLPEAVTRRVVQAVVRHRLRQVIDDFVHRVRRRLDGDVAGA